MFVTSFVAAVLLMGFQLLTPGCGCVVCCLPSPLLRALLALTFLHKQTLRRCKQL